MNCDRCKRELTGTVHTRENYRVDNYRLWTGRTIPIVFKEEGLEEKKFFKIEEPALVTVCSSCFALREVAEMLDKFESPV